MSCTCRNDDGPLPKREPVLATSDWLTHKHLQVDKIVGSGIQRFAMSGFAKMVPDLRQNNSSPTGLVCFIKRDEDYSEMVNNAFGKVSVDCERS